MVQLQRHDGAARKEIQQRIFLLASSTWQKSLDLGSTDDFSAVSTDFKNWDKGHSDYDVPQRAVFSYVYELPFRRGKRFASALNPAANVILSGWELTGITTFAKGQFQTPNLGVDWLNAGSFTPSRPNITVDVMTGRSLPDAYINPAAFAYPVNAAGQRIHLEGNGGRNTIEQPGLNNWDLGVFKNARVHERFNVQFRWEMFNAWNHTQFGRQA